MGRVHRFRRRPRNKRQFKGGARAPRSPLSTWSEGSKQFGYVQAMLVTLGVSVGVLIGLAFLWQPDKRTSAQNIVTSADATCFSPEVLDGDTIECGEERIRLYGIDAPELPGHCRRGRKCAPGDPIASTENMRRLTNDATVSCLKIDIDMYGRMVARCSVGETDLSCAQLDGGYAIRRYGHISC